jgi:putative heme-binding domain-containing protein
MAWRDVSRFVWIECVSIRCIRSSTPVGCRLIASEPLYYHRDSQPENHYSQIVRRVLALLLSLYCANCGAIFSADAGVGSSTRVDAPVLKVAPGFEGVRVYSVPRETRGSWVSLAADDRGRLYASDQYGPLHRIVLPQEPGGDPTVTVVPLPIGGAHGLTWINGSLYAVVGQKAVCPTGLYRLRDTNGDGELDDVKLLHAIDGDGEHGPHAVVASPDGKALYLIAGNATRLPELIRSRVPRFWAEDSLLAPLPALMGSETRGILPGGWICRTDLDGQTWELHCAGFRNAYSLAFVRDELFTFDSDTEFEINLPWYRPTRVLHAVSGADFGWRRGALKVPDSAPDAWPVTLPMGLGSPTAVISPVTAKFPARYRDALWVADWSYGKLFALSLQPKGATFAATREEIVSGTPLPITAACVNPLDGALYFTTGGRRLASALYRVRWIGPLPNRNPKPEQRIPPTAAAVTRRELESFHGREDPRADATAWTSLASTDETVRQAARAALESQPIATWRDRALAERSPRASLAALLALARTDAADHQKEILQALRRLHDTGLETSLRREWLRVLALTFSRGGNAPVDVRAQWALLLGPLFPSGVHDVDTALIELMVYCEAPGVAAKGLAAMRAAATRQQQLDFAKSLRTLRADWTPGLRHEFFEWLAETVAWRGGGTFARFLQRIRDDAVASAPDDEHATLREMLAVAAKKTPQPNYALTAQRPVVREWTVDDLMMLAQKDSQQRNIERGRKVFGAAGCFGCHTFENEGGALGPDLTAVAARLSLRDLFEAIVDPDREISDQYGTVEIRHRDGRRFSGRIVNLTETGLHLAENLADPSNVVRFAEADIAAIEPSKHSLMPAGLLNPLSEEEILELLAFLRSTAATRTQ